MSVSGTLENGSGNLSIKIEDDYDFAHLNEENSDLPTVVKLINNMAWGAQEIGTIENYHITIEFDYCVNCE